MTQQRDAIWGRLAEPFPEDEVKQRQGPGGRMLSYVDARAVAQRLDDVLSPICWDFAASVIPGTDVVHGRLSIHDGGTTVFREDHGYPNSDRDEEPIKAATSDALKRCAVLFGIGRHLYDDNRSTQRGARTNNGVGASSPTPVAAAAGRPSPRPAAPTTPPEPDWVRDEFAPIGNGHAVAGSSERMTVKEVLAAAEAQGIPTRDVGTTAKKLYGTPMLKELDDEQRAVVWAELAR